MTNDVDTLTPAQMLLGAISERLSRIEARLAALTEGQDEIKETIIYALIGDDDGDAKESA